jgi:hypothetical protein
MMIHSVLDERLAVPTRVATDRRAAVGAMTPRAMMRVPGDVVFALGALLMAWDFIVKLRPLFPRFVEHLILALA